MPLTSLSVNSWTGFEYHCETLQHTQKTRTKRERGTTQTPCHDLAQLQPCRQIALTNTGHLIRCSLLSHLHCLQCTQFCKTQASQKLTGIFSLTSKHSEKGPSFCPGTSESEQMHRKFCRCPVCRHNLAHKIFIILLACHTDGKHGKNKA